MTKREMLIEWLIDAHAMEKSIVKMLENQADGLDKYPELQSKIKEHIEETKSHADRVAGCVEKLGEDISSFKSGMARMFGSVESMSMGKPHDRAVKFSVASLTTEHFEIASYRVIITAAKEIEEEDIVNVCEGILQEEEEMAKWLNGRLDTTVSQLLLEEHE